MTAVRALAPRLAYQYREFMLVRLLIASLFLLACGDDTSPSDTVEPADTSVPDTDTIDTSGPDVVGPDVADSVEDIADSVSDTASADADTVADTVSDTGPDTQVVPACGNGEVEALEACDDGDLDDLDGCTRACESGPIVRPPRLGEVVIAELMVAPQRVSDLLGEWIELTSLADEPLNLSACRLEDDGTDRIDLDLEGGLILEAHSTLVLGLEDDPLLNGGVPVDLAYATMLLEDFGDELVLRCEDATAAGEAPSVEVDRVAWVPFSWPVVEGRSLSLDPTRLDTTANDRVDSWCFASGRYGLGDLGSPGATNPSCPHLDREIDRCRLIGPAAATGFRNAATLFTIEVEESGLTDLTPGVDQNPQLVVELGHAQGPAVPLEAFIFSRARPEPGYAAVSGVRSDRWRGDAITTTLGSHTVVARASRDGGITWRYCDLDGSDNGAAVLATLEVEESPCTATSCTTPPPATCGEDGVTLFSGETPGVCSPTTAPGDDAPASFTCTYPTLTTRCGNSGRVCIEDGTGARCDTTAPGPTARDLVLSEVMVTPTASRDVASGQWVELDNLAATPLLLTGCTLVHTAALGEPESVLIDTPLVVGRGRQVILGATLDTQANGGVPVDFAWGDTIELTTASTLSLVCGESTPGAGAGSGVIDTIVWNSTWPLSTGASLSLSPFAADPGRNDESTVWCRADTTYGAGDRGSPGQENPRCAGDIVPVESCRIAGPALVTPSAGTEAEVDLRILVRSITGRTARTDTNPRLWLEVGVTSADPATASTITSWRRATADGGWVSTGQGVDPAEDRYRATFTVPAPGSWRLLARATADNGNSYSLCDLDGLALGTARPLEVSPVASACHPSPCESEPAPVCDGDLVIGRTAPAICALAPGGPSCTYPEVELEDCSALGATCSEDGEAARCDDFPRTPLPGELVWSELMIAPVVAGLNNELGEWVELTHVGTGPLDLTGCALESDGATLERWELPPPNSPLDRVIMPGEALTLARSELTYINGNSAPRGVWSGLALDNAGDRLALVCDDLVVAELTWDSTWPVVAGGSLHLSGSYLDVQDTRNPNYWCQTSSPSPSVANRTCPGDGLIDDCRVLSAPLRQGGEADSTNGISASADDLLEVEVLVADAGVTDLTEGNDPAIGVVVEVGVGDPGLSPRVSLAWTWYGATTPAWDDMNAPGQDRWRASFAAARPADLTLPAGDPAAFSELAVMARVSHDGGKTFRVCGMSGFSDDPADGLELTLTPGLCAPNPCRSPQTSTCSGNTLIGYSSPGFCTVDEGTFSCQYPSRTFSCTSWGGCSAGACNTPPPSPGLPGVLVITEVMRDSGLPLPDRGEWVELKNTSTGPLDLRGCRFDNGRERSQVVAAPVPELINGNGHALFTQSQTSAENGGIPAFFVPLRTLGIDLPATTGSLTLTCGQTVIDTVTWTPSWPGPRGAAMQLDRSRTSDTLNNNATSWCSATSTYGTRSLFGTPGSLNNLCP